MANPTITNIDTGSVMLDEAHFEDGLITFAGADTFVAGTILALASNTEKWVIYVKGGNSNDNGTPRGVLTYDVTATGAGDVAGRVLVSGIVNKDRLVIDADGDASNVDASVTAALRDKNIVAVVVAQLGQVDNPQPGGDS
jgi:hypothetical protein